MELIRDKTPDEIRDDAIASLEQQVRNLQEIVERLALFAPVGAVLFERSPLHGLRLKR